MENQVFADGIGSVSVVGTTVRIDFVTLSPSERGKDGKPKPVLQQRMIMTIEGFLHAAGKFQEVSGAIRDMGVKRIAEGKAAAASTNGGTEKEAAAAKKGSAKPPFP